MLRSLAWTLIIVLLLILSAHIAFAFVNGSMVLSLTLWGLLIASIFFFCTSILLFFILTWTGVLALGFIAVVWTIVASFLFPVLLSVLLPLFVIMFFISNVRRRQNPPLK